MIRYHLRPTNHQTYEVEARGGRSDFARELKRSYELQDKGDFYGACDVRYASFRRLAEIIPDDELTPLEWNHAESRAALETTYASGVDHFLAGDTEMAMAILELLLELDPEDHLGATPLLCFCYVAEEEYALYEQTAMDIADSAEGALLAAWASFRRTGAIERDAASLLEGRYRAVVDEFCRDEHPADEVFMAAAESSRTAAWVRARELWLQTEPLWSRHGDFIDALRNEFL